MTYRSWPRFERGQEVGVIAIARIHLGLSLARHFIWHSDFAPALDVLGPGLRRVQAHRHWHVAWENE